MHIRLLCFDVPRHSDETNAIDINKIATLYEHRSFAPRKTTGSTVARAGVGESMVLQSFPAFDAEEIYNGFRLKWLEPSEAPPSAISRYLYMPTCD